MTDETDALFVHIETPMQIVGNHPHAGELCYPVGKDKTHIHFIKIHETSDPLFEVQFVNCIHGTSGAYVYRKNLKPWKGPVPA